MANPNNYGPVIDLMNRNTEMIRAAYNQQRKLYEEMQKTVVSQNARITTLAAQVAGLQQQVVITTLANHGSEATVV